LAKKSGLQSYWIGAKKTSDDGDQKKGWKWPNDEPVKFFNWLLTQPNGCCGKNVTCIIVYSKYSTGIWDDVGCDNPQQMPDGVVCKKTPT
ncbi:unnamed protein product, partial [Anisakis simplex]|uniref:C-type lectin domain-containing protein n=1 Tax=Anisakis simplex TaxID=6269 RepID=A0A0M3JLQ0_ANISI